MIESKTQTGLPVRLSGIEDAAGRPAVRAEMIHPKVGRLDVVSSSYGRDPSGRFEGILGVTNGQTTCITVSREAFDAAMTEARALREAEIESIHKDERQIHIAWSDGEVLSGYAVCGRDAEVLRILGLAQDVAGWGTVVLPAVSDRLGTEFLYSAAAALATELTAPDREAKRMAETARDEAVATARRTGRRVEIRRWSEGCCDRQRECSMDTVTLWAEPDGSTATRRAHTY